MCGIVGIVNKSETAVDPAVLALMCDAIRHRGPDEEGSYARPTVGLAMRRLAIIDLAGGQQPITNERKTAWIVFNGEIYNYRELRAKLEKLGHRFATDCDTEAIIHAYEEYGAQCPKHLRGMFAFAIWDEERQELFIARDRLGKKPLLYAETRDGLAFASEFRALLKHPSISREVAPEAIDYYLSFMCVPAPLTAFRGIKKLEPGHSLRYRLNGDIEINRYWQPDFSHKTRMDETEASARLLEVLRDAVRVRLMSEVPLGAFLSGGVDSSAVVALMSEASREPVKTFAIGFEEQDFSELAHARRVAEHVGTDHHEFIVRPDALEVLPMLVEHYGEPYADSSAVPTYYVARETRKHVTVALNGDGGDECFAGYERYGAMQLAETYRRLPALLRRGIVERAVEMLPTPEARRSRVKDAKRFLHAAGMNRAARYEHWVGAFDPESKHELYTAEFRRRTTEGASTELLARWFATANGAGVLDATLLTDTMTYLPNDLLVKVDIATMACSLEARSPFLDHHVVEFAAALPENFKLRGRKSKYLLKRALKDLLPAEILDRRKMGFGVPVGYWLRAQMQPFLRETLLSEKSLGRNLFNPASVRRLVDEHTSGAADHANMLWTLLMLELWFERFID